MSLISVLPDGGALTTLGRRLRSLAASRFFCSSGNLLISRSTRFWRVSRGNYFDT